MCVEALDSHLLLSILGKLEAGPLSMGWAPGRIQKHPCLLKHVLKHVFGTSLCKIGIVATHLINLHAPPEARETKMHGLLWT